MVLLQFCNLVLFFPNSMCPFSIYVYEYLKFLIFKSVNCAN